MISQDSQSHVLKQGAVSWLIIIGLTGWLTVKSTLILLRSYSLKLLM